MTMMLVAAYILVLGATSEKNEEVKEDCSTVLTPKYSCEPVAELEEEKGEREREEAEAEYIAPHPIYAEPEADLGKLELYIENAKNRELPRCIRMVSGMFIEQYGNLTFMEDFLKKLEPGESEAVLDAMEMGRNPELYMERHLQCESRCSNSKCPFHVTKGRKKRAASTALTVTALLCAGNAMAIGNGMSGINQATSEVSSYFAPITKLIYAIGALVGLIGAVRVYSKFSSGDPDTTKVAATWFGACIFLVIAATVLSGFFF